MSDYEVAIGSDDAGFELKERIKEQLLELGLQVRDFGCNSTEPVDYPDVAYELAKSVARSPGARGILVCGTGIGMAITANKVAGVRAAQAHDTYSAQRARKSNNAQILTLGSRVVATELAREIVRAWLASEFEGGGSSRKVEKMDRIDAGERREPDLPLAPDG
jgi:ribose 5-phosphate isomerase B